jgi:DNA polymerase-3 subunit epsilon
MLREIVLDTETTGLDPSQGHRVVEIGAVELINHIPSGRTFHVYVNPERDMPEEAFAVHGLSREFLAGHRVFAAIAEEFEAFIGADRLVIHNAAFDVGFLEWELRLLGRGPIERARIVDTLGLARQRHPMAPNSLDALCKRYAIDNSRRARHGALVDAELLAAVYLVLVGGRQASLTLAATTRVLPIAARGAAVRRARPEPLPSRLTPAEAEAHAALVASLGESALWTTWL